MDAIVDTITDLFVGTDNREWERVKKPFTPEVQFDMSSLAGGQPAKLDATSKFNVKFIDGNLTLEQD